MMLRENTVPAPTLAGEAACGVTIVSEPNIEGLQLAHGGGLILGAGLPAGTVWLAEDMVVQFRQPVDEIAGKVKALGGRDASRC